MFGIKTDPPAFLPGRDAIDKPPASKPPPDAWQARRVLPMHTRAHAQTVKHVSLSLSLSLFIACTCPCPCPSAY